MTGVASSTLSWTPEVSTPTRVEKAPDARAGTTETTMVRGGVVKTRSFTPRS